MEQNKNIFSCDANSLVDEVENDMSKIYNM
jgi:hypothetical protein